MSTMHRLLTAASWGYLACLLLLPAVWAWKGERQWLLALLRYMPALVYVVPTGLLAILAILARDATPRLPLLVSLAVIYLLYADPVLNLARHQRGTIRVVTYNILAGRLDENERLAAFLKSQDADILMIQEAYRAPFRNDPIVPLQRALENYHMVRAGDEGELAIFTRQPILDHQEFSLASRRPGMWADVELDGRRTRLFNVHYDHFDGFRTRKIRWALRATAVARARQTEHLEQQLAIWSGPIILAGDFNSPPGSDTPARLRSRLQDTYATVGTGLGQTFPSFFPLWRIDYIYASSHFKVRSSTPMPVTWSDHRPLRAELDLE